MEEQRFYSVVITPSRLETLVKRMEALTSLNLLSPSSGRSFSMRWLARASPLGLHIPASLFLHKRLEYSVARGGNHLVAWRLLTLHFDFSQLLSRSSLRTSKHQHRFHVATELPIRRRDCPKATASDDPVRSTAVLHLCTNLFSVRVSLLLGNSM